MALIILKRMILIFLCLSSSVFVLNRMPEYNVSESGACLPYVIEGTSIVLESIGEGEASGCTEAVLRNSGTDMLESFYVEIQTLSQMYHFETTMLPSGEQIILQERDGKYWEDSSIIGSYGCYSVMIESGNCGFPEVKGDRLFLRNTDQFPIKAIEVYLKPWDENKQLYLNGKTQKIVLHNLRYEDVVEVILPDYNYKIVYYEVNATAATHDAAAECIIKVLSKGSPAIWGARVR